MKRRTERPAHGGLPIAAHLTLLVSLAVSAAFLAAMAIVLLLPPRPPEVMRADLLVANFATAFMQARKGEALSANESVSFSIADRSPVSANRGGDWVRRRLAKALQLNDDLVRVRAKEERRDHFVFRVQHSQRDIEVKTEETSGVTRVTTTDPKSGETRTVEVRTQVMAPKVELKVPAFEWAMDIPAPANAPPPPPALPGSPAPVIAPPPPPPPPVFAPAPAGVALLSGFDVSAQLPDGRWLTMSQARNEDLAWILRAAATFAATLLSLGLIAWVFARRLAQPIQAFSRAVEGVGVDPGHAPVTPRGPQELQRAAEAINAMQARLRTLIADRTKTLATVAHDMRTPLMRMRLAAENAPPETRQKMAKEIAEVEALVASFIAFARDDPAEEKRVRLDLSALLESLVEDHVAAGRLLTFDGEDRVVITGQPLGLKRVFANLLDNAIKYGGRANVTMRRTPTGVEVDVADDGPGVPASMREEIFKPFVRGVHETGGAGLGLAAARSIARAHGGDIVVADSNQGALLRVTLPVGA